MRLLRWKDGRLILLCLPATLKEVEDLILRAANPSGEIDCLVLDFSGSYITLVSGHEARLAARLLLTYRDTPTALDPPTNAETVCAIFDTV
jgi:hypothetical protein